MNTIRVVFQYARLTGHTDTPPAISNSRGAVHERAAKKAHGDMAGLGAPRPSTANRWCYAQVLPELGKFEFVFHYAPSGEFDSARSRIALTKSRRRLFSMAKGA